MHTRSVHKTGKRANCGNGTLHDLRSLSFNEIAYDNPVARPCEACKHLLQAGTISPVNRYTSPRRSGKPRNLCANAGRGSGDQNAPAVERRRGEQRRHGRRSPALSSINGGATTAPSVRTNALLHDSPTP